MASITRKSAWNNGGTFANPDLLWYAKGVGVMKSLPLNNPNSWWFFAAIHGQFITPDNTAFPGWAFIPELPQAQFATLPSDNLQQRFWDQCQHQSWFFPPWHRGYLIALEAQIRAALETLPGAPSDWALPYWNYFGNANGQDESQIPPAFTEPNLPDGTPNPLFVKARHGPDIQRPGAIFTVKDTSPDPERPNGINTVCQNNTLYTGFNGVTNTPGYGGPPTGFWHGTGTNGNLEGNPHNPVHTDVGGTGLLNLFSIGIAFVADLNNSRLPAGLRNAFSGQGIMLTAQARVAVGQIGVFWRIIDVGQNFLILNNQITNMLDVDSADPANIRDGLMSNPGTAALDPIFYLHHCNIDRMWAAWNQTNSNLTDQFWVSGPAAIGQRGFVMPMPGNIPWTYTPTDVNSLALLDYDYDDLNSTISPQPSNRVAQRLMRLGVAFAAANAAQGANMGAGEDVELLGAHDGALQVMSSGTRATVRLDADVQRRMFATLANAPATQLPDHVYLHLENVRGTRDSFKLNVSVNQQPVGTVALFGLGRASSMDGPHGGVGLNFIFDITDIMDNLFLANTPDVDSLDVTIEPNNPLVDIAQITIGRVSVYRQGVQG